MKQDQELILSATELSVDLNQVKIDIISKYRLTVIVLVISSE